MTTKTDQEPFAACGGSADWVEVRKGDRWQRVDGAVVKIDHSVELSTSRPWLPNYRGWEGWGPGDNDSLVFSRRNTRFRVRRKFKTAGVAMKAVDSEYPLNTKLSHRSEGVERKSTA